MIMPGAGQQLALGDEEQIDERLARRAHQLEGRLAKLGTAGITKPKDLLEFVNNLKYKDGGGPAAHGRLHVLWRADHQHGGHSGRGAFSRQVPGLSERGQRSVQQTARGNRAEAQRKG